MELTETISLKRTTGKNQGFYYYCKYDSSASERITKEKYDYLVKQGEGKHTERLVDDCGNVVSMVYTHTYDFKPAVEVAVEVPSSDKCPSCGGTNIATQRYFYRRRLSKWAGVIGYLFNELYFLTVKRGNRAFVCLDCKHNYSL